MQRIFIASLLALPFLPLFTFALEAGFPEQPIWVSLTSPREGETVVISTVVRNDAAKSLRGTLVFSASGSRIGVREFELPSGASQIHSIEWKPKAGAYEVGAAIEGTSAEISRRETAGLAIEVLPPPEPSAVEAAVSQAAETAGSIASSTIPVVKQIANTVFEAIEPYREKVADGLSEYIAKTDPGVKGVVAGTTTSKGSASPPQASEASALQKGARMAAAAALFVVGNLYLFYPLLALIVLGTLYLLAKRVRRRPE